MRAQTAAFHWSGGKDSTLALSTLLAHGDVVVDRLVTTTHPERRESTVHGIPVELLEAQALSIGIRLQTIPLPGAGLDSYVEVMQAAAAQMRREGIDAFAFGDLTCSDVRGHKQEQFGPLGIEILEPLWGMTSRECIEAFLLSGKGGAGTPIGSRHRSRPRRAGHSALKGRRAPG
jgi:diphthamide synthase (EF-2-diphthine--ammonia ligase)